jgi:hypothetical protein
MVVAPDMIGAGDERRLNRFELLGAQPGGSGNCSLDIGNIMNAPTSPPRSGRGLLLVGHGHPHTIRAMRARKVPKSRAQNTAATASVAE